MAAKPTWLDDFFTSGSPIALEQDGVATTQRKTLNFVGGTATLTDDSINDRTNIEIIYAGALYTIDATSSAPTKGKVVALKSGSSDPALIVVASGGAHLGVLVEDHVAGDTGVRVAVDGSVLPNSVTGLGASSDGKAHKVTFTSTGSLAYVYFPSGGETIVGHSPGDGRVTLAQEAPLITAPRFAYNPRSYGAACDNVTDDTAAWTALKADMAIRGPNAGAGYLIEMGLGLSYVPKGVFFDRGVIIVGHSGGGQYGLSGIRSAAGYCPLMFSNGVAITGYPTPTMGSDASWCHVERLDLRSSALVPVHTNPYSLTGGVSGHRAASTAYEIGVSVVDAANANIGDGGTSTCGNGTKFGCFLQVTAVAGDKKTSASAEAALTGTGGRTFATALPGDVFVDGNVTWTAIGFATKAIRSTAQKVGETIMNVGGDRYNGGTAYTQDDDNRYIFVCEVAGNTPASALPVAFNQPEVGALLTWGTAQYRVKIHSAIFSTAGSTTVRRCTIKDCTNYAITLWGETGQGTDADWDILDNIYVQGSTGGGVFLGTDQAQGCTIGRIFCNFAGIITPGSTQTNNAGGHSYYGHSQGGEDVSMIYGQFSFGRNIFGLANNSLFRSTFSEVSTGDLFAAGQVKIGGTPGIAAPITPDGAVIIAGINGYGRGLVEYDKLTGTTVGRGFTKQDSGGGLGITSDWWSVSSDGASQWQRIFNWSGGGLLNSGTGWDAEVWKTSGGYSSIGRGRSHFGSVQGPGFDREYLGHFVGAEGGTISFFGIINAGFDASTHKQVRMLAANTDSGNYKAGDWFLNTGNVALGSARHKIYTTDGHRGLARVDSTQYFAASGTDYAAQIIQIGVKVFRCTTSGITQSGVPAGYGTAIVGGTVTDGTAVFTRVTDAPSEGFFGLIEDGITGLTPQTSTAWKDTAATDAGATCPKEYALSYRWQASTTTNTANQTLFAIPAFPDNSTVTIAYELDAKRNGNHASYMASEGKQKAGRNNGAAPEFATGTYSTDAGWGAENSLAGMSFDIVTDGANGAFLRVNNPPAYQVDYGGIVQVNVRIA